MSLWLGHFQVSGHAPFFIPFDTSCDSLASVTQRIESGKPAIPYQL